MYLNVQGLICHKQSGTPRTILYIVEHQDGIQGPWYATNGMSLGSGKQRKPSTVSSLAAPAGLRDIHKVIRFTVAVSSYVFLGVCFNLIV